jgi:hypothetical protein
MTATVHTWSQDRCSVNELATILYSLAALYAQPAHFAGPDTSEHSPNSTFRERDRGLS